MKKVGAHGNPVRYQWGAYGRMQNEWTIQSSIWVVSQKLQSFCPIVMG